MLQTRNPRKLLVTHSALNTRRTADDAHAFKRAQGLSGAPGEVLQFVGRYQASEGAHRSP